MKTFIKLGGILILLSGCDASHLVYVHETSLGVDVAVSPQEGTGRFVLGYDRDTYALVPHKSESQEAMTVASLSCIYADGLDEVQFKHFVSTGSAAIGVAKDKQLLAQIKKAVQGGGETCEK